VRREAEAMAKMRVPTAKPVMRGPAETGKAR